MNLDQIKALLQAHRPVLSERFKVREIGVFGSYARGDQTDQSDIDVLVEFSEPVGFFAFIDLEEYLQTVLGRRIDLVSKKALKPRIGRRILQEIVTIG